MQVGTEATNKAEMQMINGTHKVAWVTLSICWVIWLFSIPWSTLYGLWLKKGYYICVTCHRRKTTNCDILKFVKVWQKLIKHSSQRMQGFKWELCDCWRCCSGYDACVTFVSAIGDIDLFRRLRNWGLNKCEEMKKGENHKTGVNRQKSEGL